MRGIELKVMAVSLAMSVLLVGGADVHAGTNDYIFVPTADGLLSGYRVQCDGTLAFLSNLTLPVPANDTTTFSSRGLLYVALGQQGVDLDLQVQVYAVDYETGGLTLLQTLDVAEEPSRVVVTDAGTADAIYMVSEDSLLLTAYVLNGDGTIGAQIDQRDLAVDTPNSPGALVDFDITADGRHLYATTQKWMTHYETTQGGTLIFSSNTLSPAGGNFPFYSLDIDNSTGSLWTTAKTTTNYRIDRYPVNNGVPETAVVYCCRTSLGQPTQMNVRDDFAYVANTALARIEIYEYNGAAIVYQGLEFVSGFPIAVAIHPTDDLLWVANSDADEMLSYSILPSGLLGFLGAVPGAGEPTGITLMRVPLNAEPSQFVDCNSNGLPDAVDLTEFVEHATLTAGDPGTDDLFGRSVSMDGDTAILGAPNNDVVGSNSGSAYVFVRTAGVWSQQVRLTPLDASSGDSFGSSVSIDGDSAVIGADGDDHAGGFSGSAYVFVRSGGVWTQQAKLTASDAAASDFFGDTVAISGDTVVVGGHNNDDAGDNSGSAYVFIRNGVNWSQQTKLTASDAAAGDQFGNSVSIDGDTAVVGAYLADNTGADSGSAYAFVRTNGIWSQQTKFNPTQHFNGDRFGFAVSMCGSSVVVGAPEGTFGGGKAYVFVRNGAAWTQQALILPPDSSNEDQFGRAVSILGESMVIGSPYDDEGAEDAGSAYVYGRVGEVWTLQTKLVASDGEFRDHLGFSVAMKDGVSLVGVQSDDSPTDSGSARMFDVFSDCNGNEIPDDCEINDFPFLDCNGNGMLDACEGPTCVGILAGDMDCNGAVDLADLPAFVESLLNGAFSCNADVNGDLAVDGRDVSAMISLLIP